MTQSLTPTFKWAEDAERIFLTIELQSATDVQIKLAPTHFTFSAKQASSPDTYTLDFELPKSINTDKSTWSVKGRQVEVVLVKSDEDEGYWHALLKDKNQYKGRVKIDWDLWRDEDEEKALPDDFGGMGGMGGMGGGMGGMPGMGGMGGMGGGMGGMDMASMMANMGGGGGFGGMGGGDDDEEGDSDDEEIPGLEDKETGGEEGGKADTTSGSTGKEEADEAATKA